MSRTNLKLATKSQRTLSIAGSIGLFLWLALAPSLHAQIQQTIAGHVPAAVARLKAIRHLENTNLDLVIGLPVHDQAGLDQLLGQLHDPSSTNYHHWLTPGEFSQRFGPSKEDYQKVIAFAQAGGFKVTAMSSNRMLLNVTAPVPSIEKALHLNLHVYQHPTENRTFYAPDADPVIDASVPILHISGLDNFVLPHRLGGALKPVSFKTNGITAFYTGSAPGGFYMGRDFRNAYVPGVTNTGAGQYIAIVDVGGQYYPADVYNYETNAGLSTNTVVTNIVTTFTSYWTTPLTGSSTDDGEEALDICMALSMAPGATILNYEGEAHNLFNQIATDDLAHQMTLSYGFGIDSTIIQTFKQFLAQGQALSQASGDGDSDLNGGTGLTGNPYATIVGGTTLTTSGASGPWSSETAWNWGGNGGSGGGISGYGIPDWQQGVATAANQGSPVYRNYPDVAMPADGVFLISKNGTSVGSVGGTSCASPLWAGFMALANQQAASLGKPAVGFPNPSIYALGKAGGTAYASAFHDIVTGNNFDSQNPARFSAVSGYDLCTGWGTPRGINTINAFVGDGTNDFLFYTSVGSLNVVRGGSSTVILTVAYLNGYSSNISFSVSGLTNGVTAAVSPVSTTNSSFITLNVGSTAPAGTNLITITGISGALSHSATFSLNVITPVPATTRVSLTPYFNRSGIWTDKRTFSGGMDGGGYAYSANLLGTSPSWNGIVFTLGPTNASDAVSCSGQVISLTAGSYNSVQILGTAVNVNQLSQNFIVTYTDNTTTTISQSLSDWANPQHYAGESQVVTMPWRDNGGGSQDLGTTVYLYNYTLPIDQTKTVKSLTLPGNANVILMAVTLANDPVPVTLSAFYNRAGIYADGITFSNPATGGADGSGSAYSASLLTGSQIWTNTLFNFGPANATNIISAAGQIITLPAGHYTDLRMLASGVQGSQASKSFIVKYTDGTSSSFVQSLSDWFTPSSLAGETKAEVMGHRNSQDGTKDNRTFYLYGYSFKLNSAKVVASLTLPVSANVLVAAVSLVPNWTPAFLANPFAESSVTAGQFYFASMATNAYDLNGDSLTYAKVSGPAWLSVSGNGAISGSPLSPDAGLNSFVVSVNDPGTLTNTAVLNINVLPAAPILTGITNDFTGTWIYWSGGIAPYQVQMNLDLTTTNWVNIGDPGSSSSFFIDPSNPAAFYRLTGQ